jgi:hypothetical protein
MTGNGDGIMPIVMVGHGIVFGMVDIHIGVLGISILGMDIGAQVIGTGISGITHGIMAIITMAQELII